ncbi:transcription antitermination factor NusB [Marinicrinis sediminis]|uniref:Transcription antitermination protein NusB n=1 Tax=Marinicrinis sediminis TaxID=1652465 RepID=A0ABW5RDK5_9BACL
MKRRTAREIAVQSLYQLEMNEASSSQEAIQSVLDAEADENEQFHQKVIDVAFIQQMIEGVLDKKTNVDQVITQYLTRWKVDRLSRVDKQILRLAVYEMVYAEDVPDKVAVNEAIELSKHFGTEESGKFVNGVLGNMLKEADKIKQNIQS